MTSDALAAARARFWRSVWRYYQAKNQYHGMVKASNEIAWERAKEDLLRVAERVKGAPPPPPEPEPPHYRHRCPACGILQASREVCAECVAIWGSAEAAMRARQETRPGRRPGPRPSKTPYKPQHTRAELRAAELQRRAEIAAALREHLAKYGAVHLPTMVAMLGAGKTLIWDVLHKIMSGEDGQPPLPLTPPDGYDRYWRVTR